MPKYAVNAKGIAVSTQLTRGLKSTTREIKTLESSPNTGGLRVVFPAQSQASQAIVPLASQFYDGLTLVFACIHDGGCYNFPY